MQGDLGPIRVLPRACRLLEFLLGEVPVGGPGSPEESAKLSPIGLDGSFSSRCGEEPVIPVVARLRIRDPLTRIVGSIADGQSKQALHTLGVQRGKDVCSSRAPIVPDENEPGQPKALSQLNRILSERSELA